MTNKGFTLIEILGVIVILGLLFLLVAPPVLNSISAHKPEVDNAQRQMVEGAADLYFDSHLNETRVNVLTLKNSGYLDNNFGTQTNTSISNSTCIRITQTNPRIVEMSGTC